MNEKLTNKIKEFTKIYTPWFAFIVIIITVLILVFQQSKEAVQKAFSGIAHSCANDQDCPSNYPNCVFDPSWGYARCVEEEQKSCTISMGMKDAACDLSDINSCSNCINSPPWTCRSVSPAEPFIFRKGFCQSQDECDSKYPDEGLLCQSIPSRNSEVDSNDPNPFQSPIKYCTLEVPYSVYDEGFGWCLPATNLEESAQCNPYTAQSTYMQTATSAGETVEIWGCSCLNVENFDHIGSPSSDCTRQNACNNQLGFGTLFSPIKDDKNSEIECFTDADCNKAEAPFSLYSGISDINFGDDNVLKCWDKQTGAPPGTDFRDNPQAGVCYANWSKNALMRDGRAGANRSDPFTNGFCRCKEGYRSSRSTTFVEGEGEIGTVYDDFSCYTDPCADNIDMVIPAGSPIHYLSDTKEWTCPEQASLGLDFCEAGTCKCCDCSHSFKIGGRPTIACPQDFTANSLASNSLCKGRARCVGDSCWVQESNSKEVRLRNKKTGKISLPETIRTVEDLQELIENGTISDDMEILTDFKGRWDPSSNRSRCICPAGYVNTPNSQVPTKQVCQSTCKSNGPCGSGATNRGNCVYQISPINVRFNKPGINSVESNENALTYPEVLPERICAPIEHSSSDVIDSVVIRQCLQKNNNQIEALKRGFQHSYVKEDGTSSTTASSLDDIVQNPYGGDTTCTSHKSERNCEAASADKCKWFPHLYNETTQDDGLCIVSDFNETEFYSLTIQGCRSDIDCGTACTACKNCFQPQQLNLDYGSTFVNDFNEGRWQCNSSNNYVPANSSTQNISNCCGVYGWSRGETDEMLVYREELTENDEIFTVDPYVSTMCYGSTTPSDAWQLNKEDIRDNSLNVNIDGMQTEIFDQCMGAPREQADFIAPDDLILHSRAPMYNYGSPIQTLLEHTKEEKCKEISVKARTNLAQAINTIPHDKYGSPNGMTYTPVS